MKLTDSRLDLIARDLGMKAISPVIAVAGLVIEGRETAAIAERLGTGVDQVRAIADRVRALIEQDKTKRAKVTQQRRPSALIPMPADWRASDADRKYAADLGFSSSVIDREEIDFRAYWIRRGDKRNWSLTWMNWIRRHANDSGLKPNDMKAQLNRIEPTPDIWKQRVETFRDLGAWQASFGPEPGQRGCKVPPEILREVRV